VGPEILIVGDRTQRGSLIPRVQDLGYIVTPVRERELSERVRASPAPAAVLVCLGEADAAALVDAARAGRDDVPVILVGSLGGALRDLADVLELGADHFLATPVVDAELASVLAEFAGPGAPGASDDGPEASAAPVRGLTVDPPPPSRSPIHHSLEILAARLQAQEPEGEGDVDLEALGIESVPDVDGELGAPEAELVDLEPGPLEHGDPEAPPRPETTQRLSSARGGPRRIVREPDPRPARQAVREDRSMGTEPGRREAVRMDRSVGTEPGRREAVRMDRFTGGAASEGTQRLRAPVRPEPQRLAVPEETTARVAARPDLGETTARVAARPDLGETTARIAVRPDLGEATARVAVRADVVARATSRAAGWPAHEETGRVSGRVDVGRRGPGDLRDAERLRGAEVLARLWQLHAQRSSGRLRVGFVGGAVKQVWWRRGVPVYAASSAAEDGLPARLQARGLIGRGQATAAARVADEDLLGSARRLVQAGLLKPREQAEAVRDAVLRIVESLCADAAERWLVDAEPPPADIGREAPLLALLASGARLGLSRERLRADLPESSCVAVEAPDLAGLAGQLGWPEAAQWLGLLDGGRSLGQLVAEDGLDERELWAAAHTLLAAGLAVLREADAEAALVAIDRRRIEERLALAGSSDYFTLLGVPRDAGRSAVLRAHAELRETFAEARLEPRSREELADELAALQAALDEACEVLLDEALRAAYLAHLGE